MEHLHLFCHRKQKNWWRSSMQNPQHVRLVFPMSVTVYLSWDSQTSEWLKKMAVVAFIQTMHGWMDKWGGGGNTTGRRGEDGQKPSAVENLVASIACYFASLWLNKEPCFSFWSCCQAKLGSLASENRKWRGKGTNSRTEEEGRTAERKGIGPGKKQRGGERAESKKTDNERWESTV